MPQIQQNTEQLKSFLLIDPPKKNLQKPQNSTKKIDSKTETKKARKNRIRDRMVNLDLQAPNSARKKELLLRENGSKFFSSALLEEVQRDEEEGWVPDRGQQFSS
jgi:hypothetical protein